MIALPDLFELSLGHRARNDGREVPISFFMGGKIPGRGGIVSDEEAFVSRKQSPS
jgi:hypothetical protein